MAVFKTNDPTQFDDIDGIIIDEQTPPSAITGVAANVGVLVGQFQRGPKELSLALSSIAELHEKYGKSDYLGNLQLRNKAFGALRIIKVEAADSVKAELELESKLKLVAKYKGAYGNLLKVTIENASDDIVSTTPAVKAVFSGAITGVTGNVELEASLVGVIGDGILLSGDGVKDLTTLVADWNTANPTNPVVLTSANGADVPANLLDMQLAGGADLVETVTTEGGAKIIIADTNAGSVLATETYDNILMADITPATFANSKLVDAVVLDAASGELSAAPEAPLAGGTDGTILDTDYESAIARAEEGGAGNVLFLDEYNPVRNQMLKTHAGIAQDKMVICAGKAGEDKDVVIAEAANLKDAAGRIIYAWPYVETLINGVNTLTSPASWLASIYTQVAPNVALSYTANTRYLGGMTGLEFTTGRNGHIALDQAGVAAFERDPDIGFVLKNAIVTQTINSQLTQILRRRMADFLQDSIARAMKNWQNDVNSVEKREEMKAAIVAFDTNLVVSGVLPGDEEVKGGKAMLVDADSLNTDESIEQGIVKIIYKRRIYSSMRYIVLQTEIGTGVVVTEVN